MKLFLLFCRTLCLATSIVAFQPLGGFSCCIQHTHVYSSEASFQLIHPKKYICRCVCSTNIGFSVEKKCLGLSVGYVLCTTYVCTWYQQALRCQLRGRPFHPWAGRLRFSGEAHPGPATFTLSSSFSYGAGLQSESRLLLCCTSERFVANCGVGPSTREQGDSACLVTPTQHQRRQHKAVVSLVGRPPK